MTDFRPIDTLHTSTVPGIRLFLKVAAYSLSFRFYHQSIAGRRICGLEGETGHPEINGSSSDAKYDFFSPPRAVKKSVCFLP